MNAAMNLSMPLSKPPVLLEPEHLGTQVLAVIMWAINLPWLVGMMVFMMLLMLVIPADNIQGISRIYTRVQLLLLGCRYRVELDPAVDPDSVYMFCQNHVNLLDHITMYTATPHFKQGMELEQHFKIPVYGWFMKLRGTIGVRRGSMTGTRQLLQHMRAEVDKGHSLLVFPEGTRTRTGRVGTCRKGVFFLARDLGIPVVPVAVTGMYETMRTGSWLLRPGYTVTVHVMAPIPTVDLTDEQIPQLAQTVQRRLAENVDIYWNGKQERTT
ncbi:MAG: 1-acyl-sn-glycerol-3-phosphate acyltransferase [Kiritimatiellia bacterium]|jgi:1-acyl-sn-glycerol-3-phosphate acyltransferase